MPRKKYSLTISPRHDGSLEAWGFQYTTNADINSARTYRRVYYGYTEQEVRRMFKEHVQWCESQCESDLSRFGRLPQFSEVTEQVAYNLYEPDNVQ